MAKLFVILVGPRLSVKRLLEAVPVLEASQQRQMVQRLTVRLAQDFLLNSLQQLAEGDTFLFHTITQIWLQSYK